MELMGKEVIAHLNCGEQEFEAVVDPRTDFHVAMNLNNAQLFPRDAEVAVR